MGYVKARSSRMENRCAPAAFQGIGEELVLGAPWGNGSVLKNEPRDLVLD